MITKVQTISHTKNALCYCERGGELLATSKCFGNADDIYKQMKAKEKLNDRCVKQSFHIKIRIAPEDKGKLSNQDWIDVSNSYALKMGFEKNMFAVYIHQENTEKEHIHIVASRICDNNLAVPDNFTHFRSLDFSRQMEKKYKLRQVQRKLEKLKQQQKFISHNNRSINLKKAILSAIRISNSLDEVVKYLNSENIQTKIGRGISFIDPNGVKKKGSEIDRKLSLSGIQKILIRKKLKEQIKEEPKKNQIKSRRMNT